MGKKIGVMLAGCGVFDGSEIHEAVLTLLAVAREGAEAVCMAPDMEQFHVLNHLTQEEMSQTRNVLVESARIARGEIEDLKDVSAGDLDALILPGGFGAAKNLSDFAIKGPDDRGPGRCQTIVGGDASGKKAHRCHLYRAGHPDPGPCPGDPGSDHRHRCGYCGGH